MTLAVRVAGCCLRERDPVVEVAVHNRLAALRRQQCVRPGVVRLRAPRAVPHAFTLARTPAGAVAVTNSISPVGTSARRTSTALHEEGVDEPSRHPLEGAGLVRATLALRVRAAHSSVANESRRLERERYLVRVSVLPSLDNAQYAIELCG